MLSWVRRMLVPLALCVLLSLTLATATALACPGEAVETVTLTPSRWTSPGVGSEQTFTFRYVSGPIAPEWPVGNMLIVESTRFRVMTERSGCRKLRTLLRPGGSCTVVVKEENNTGFRNGRLRVDLDSVNRPSAISDLIGS